jgi:plastocyanin
MADLDRLARAAALGLLLGLAGSASLHAAAAEVQLLQQDGKPVPEAVLVVYAVDGRALPAPAPAVMDQRDRRFVPRVLPVQTGAEVTFPNSDNVSHHVYSFSPPKRFQLYLAKGGSPQSVVFDRAGVETLGCNLHDWMLGYILVVDTPYFAVTDEHGRARVGGLVAGAYRLEVWHPRFPDPKARYAREATLEEGKPAIWELRLERPLLPARDQKPGFVEY